MTEKTDMQALGERLRLLLSGDALLAKSDFARATIEQAIAALAARDAMSQSEFAARVLGAIHDYAVMKPEEDEDWESWYTAAFELLGSNVGALFAARDAQAESGAMAILPDGSAFFTASLPLPKDHWLYAPRCEEWDDKRDTTADTPHPILTHAQRDAVVAAVRYAIRGATMCGKDADFDPDALVQNAVYALCGPFGFDDAAAAPQAQGVAEGWKLVPIEPTREMRKAGLAHTGAVNATYRDMLAAAPSREHVGEMEKRLHPDDVEWVVNDIAELGVKIGNQFFFLYKGYSLVYEDPIHDDGSPMHWRPVFKREFGECAHPINYDDPTRIGTVSLNDSEDWQPLPKSDASPSRECGERQLSDAIVDLVWGWAGLDDLAQRAECCRQIRALLSKGV